MDNVIEPPRPTRALKEHSFVKAFSEYPSSAVRSIAEKAACHDTQTNAPA